MGAPVTDGHGRPPPEAGAAWSAGDDETPGTGVVRYFLTRSRGTRANVTRSYGDAAPRS